MKELLKSDSICQSFAQMKKALVFVSHSVGPCLTPRLCLCSAIVWFEFGLMFSKEVRLILGCCLDFVKGIQSVAAVSKAHTRNLFFGLSASQSLVSQLINQNFDVYSRASLTSFSETPAMSERA